MTGLLPPPEWLDAETQHYVRTPAGDIVARWEPAIGAWFTKGGKRFSPVRAEALGWVWLRFFIAPRPTKFDLPRP